jgi:ATP phosphoribosyltransferase regulatory subunit
MPTDGSNYLLPAGLADVLPGDAAFEAAMVERVMAVFAAWGYDRVKPPLIEFEDSLLSGPGAAMAAHTFRLMDPVSQRMMGLRADITPQVARIAASRLKNSPRPLRLSYAGQVLRVKGEQMRPERQLGQAGVELVGATSAAADAEVVLLAVDALRQAGVPNLAVDLNLPTLTPTILAAAGIANQGPLIAALDRKDVAAVRQLAGQETPLLEGLLRAIGPASRAMAQLLALDLPQVAVAQRQRLVEVVNLIQAAAPDLALTIDPTDHRGFEYHTGITFSLLGRRVSGEFGRGGRYVNQAGEEATGFTLYLNTILAALPAPVATRRIFLPYGTKPDVAASLRAQGWVTLQDLEATAAGAVAAEAKRSGCQFLWNGNAAVEL